MAEVHACTSCALAVWSKTATGRLHPSGDGRCIWGKKVAFPAAAYEHELHAARRVLERGHWYINRRQPIARCDTFQKAAKQ